MTVSDALRTVGWATEAPSREVDVDALIVAARTLAERVLDQASELERERARRIRVEDIRPAAHVEGYPLIEGSDGGGRRHFVDGAPVHAGSGLYLLTFRGWLAGRYEWNWRRDTPPGFFFALPEVGPEVSVPIWPAARLAWPAEVEAATR